MKNTALTVLLLLCPCIVFAQRRPEPASSTFKESELLPPPVTTTFQGRTLYRLTDTDVKAPEVVSAPDPMPLRDFSAGTVIVWCVVGTDGKPYLVKVAHRLSMEADMKAVENVKQWKFKPAKIKNQEVDVLMTVEVVWR
jgi:TonB family protein